jgi:hypothetical protein
MTPERRKIMGEISLRIKEELERVIHLTGNDSLVKSSFFSMPLYRFNHPLIRAYFVFIAAEYLDFYDLDQKHNLGIPQRFFDTEFPFIVELVMSIQYLENQILDKKAGVVQEQQVNWQKIEDNLLSSHYLKDFLYQYILEQSCIGTKPDLTLKVLQTVRSIFQFVDHGQKVEKIMAQNRDFEKGISSPHLFDTNHVTHQIFESVTNEWCDLLNKAGITAEYQSFTRNYSLRICYTNAAFFYFCTALLTELKGNNTSIKKDLLRFSIEFGILTQLVNDVTDYLPDSYTQATLTKNATDAMSDLRNGNITLPYIMYVSSQQEQQKTFYDLTLDLNLEENKIRLFQELKPICGDMIIPFLKNSSVNLKHFLDESNPKFGLFYNIGSITSNQRFFKYFKVINL